MLTALLFLAILSVLVLIHEAGHYFAARLFGVKADEFGYGFPPRALGFVKVNGKWKRVKNTDQKSYPNTIWSINWLPLGGFVRLKGEVGESHEPDSFLAQSGWKKFIILAAGVMMNWIFAALIFSAGFSLGVPAETTGLPSYAIVSDQRVQITQVVAGSPAEKAGIKLGDRLASVNGETASKSDDYLAMIAQSASSDKEIDIGVLRGGQTLHLQTTPAFIQSIGRNGVGIALSDTGTVRFPFPISIAQGFAVTLEYTKLIVMGFVSLVRDIFVQHKVTADVSGPVGIAVLTGSVAEQGFWALMQFTALLSLNLAVINFLPIPALDGGRAVFVLIDGLRKKRMDPRFEAAIHQIGFVALMVLIFIVTAQDLHKYGGAIWGGLKGLVGL